jgi:hypothetical protein
MIEWNFANTYFLAAIISALLLVLFWGFYLQGRRG